MEKQYNTQEALQPGAPVAAEGTTVPVETTAPEEAREPALQGAEKKDLSQADQAYISGLMKMLHGKQTAPTIEEMLQSGPPEKSIPAAALQVNAQMEQAVGKKPPLETCLIAGVYLVQDLVEIGNTAGYFEITSEEQLKPILQDTIQQYIEAGLADGTIDPVELQAAIEPLMDEEQRATGMQAAEMTGIPTQPNEQTAMSMYGKQMESKGIMKGGQK